MARHARVAVVVAQLQARAQRSRRPREWPEALESLPCPLCGQFSTVAQYRYMGRVETVAHLMNLVLVCPVAGCGHIFAPTSAYFDLAQQVEAPPGYDSSPASPRSG